MRRSLGVLVVAGLLLGVSGGAVSHAAPGTPDRTFGEKPGRTILDGPLRQEDANPFDVVTFDDGSTVWRDGYDGYGDRARLIRYTADGTPAPDFGTDGTSLFPVLREREAWFWGMKRQGDALLVLSYNDDGLFYLERWDAHTGQRDDGFGTGGTFRFDFTKPLETTERRNPAPMMLDVDESGRIYLAASDGYFNSARGIIRLTPDGVLDKSWADKGTLVMFKGPCDRSPQGFEVLPSGLYSYYSDCLRRFDETGKLAQVIQFGGAWYFDTDLLTPGPDDQFYAVDTSDSDQVDSITKFNANGTVDTSYGTNGLLHFENEGERFANPTVDTAGRILISGGADPEELDGSYEVLRFTTDGDPDPTFGDAGVASFDAGGRTVPYPRLVSVPDGTIVQTGSTGMKLDDAGEPFPGFGQAGILAFKVTLPPDDKVLDSLAISGGKTLVAGQSNGRAAFVRLKRFGKVDLTFGENGWVKLPVTTAARKDAAKNVSPTPDGDYVACVETPKGVYVARILKNGNLDPNFGDDGQVRVTGMRRCGGIAVDGRRTLVAGNWGNQSFVAVRLSADGAWDKSYGNEGLAWGPRAGSYRNSSAFTMFPDGGILISSPYEVFRFDAQGKPEKSFSRDGSTKLPEGGMQFVRSLLVTRAGQIYVAGDTNSNPVIYKLDSRGKRVRSFGFRSVRILENPKNKVVTSDFKLQGDGKLVFSASARSRECRIRCGRIWLYRLKADGAYDRKFGKRGIAEARYGFNSLGNTVSLSSRGIVVGGMAETSSGFEDMVVARFKR